MVSNKRKRFKLSVHSCVYHGRISSMVCKIMTKQKETLYRSLYNLQKIFYNLHLFACSCIFSSFSTSLLLKRSFDDCIVITRHTHTNTLLLRFLLTNIDVEILECYVTASWVSSGCPGGVRVELEMR